MTPAARCSGSSLFSLLSAPRSLNEPVGCSVSSFSTMSAPVSAEREGAATAGVRSTSPAIVAAALLISARVTGRVVGPVIARGWSLRRQDERLAAGVRAEPQPVEIVPALQEVGVVPRQRVARLARD